MVATERSAAELADKVTKLERRRVPASNSGPNVDQLAAKVEQRIMRHLERRGNNTWRQR